MPLCSHSAGASESPDFKAKAGERGYRTLINDTLRQAKERENLEETLRRVIREELHHDTRGDT
jgi:hypothetical protein